MRRPARLLVFGILFAFGSIATATLTGDEDFGPATNGYYYVFADKTVHVINPTNSSVLANLTMDSNNMPLTSAGASGGSNTTSRTWNDVTFIEDAARGYRYVVANEGDTYLSADATMQYGYTSIIDATTRKFVARLQVGARPVHLYAINQTNTVWTHSDAEGVFYLIPVNSSANLTVTKKLAAYQKNPGHGKLVINTALYPIGYGTNVAEQVLPKFNLSSATKLANVSYAASVDNQTCTGTHTIVYSRVNRHLLIECVDGVGVLEWNTANDSFVALHKGIVGVVTGSPADDIVFVGDNENSRATVLKPGANGVASTVLSNLTVNYNPTYPAFYSNSSSTSQPLGYTNYTIYFPLTRNTNKNNIAAAGAAVTTLAYAVMPSDCNYTNATVSAASVGHSHGDDDDEEEGLTLSLGTNGVALTPSCGACAAGINNSDPTQFTANLSGFGVLDLSALNATGTNLSTMLVSAGATRPSLNLETGANQCSFTSENYRAVKRGGQYIATVADFPQPSIYLVDASSPMRTVSFVATASHPTKIAWVPSAV